MNTYSDILGKPGTGIHQYRLFGLAIVDVIFTFIGAYILYKIFKKYSFWVYLISLFVLGIILHHLFGVKTTIEKVLFG